MNNEFNNNTPNFDNQDMGNNNGVQNKTVDMNTNQFAENNNVQNQSASMNQTQQAPDFQQVDNNQAINNQNSYQQFNTQTNNGGMYQQPTMQNNMYQQPVGNPMNQQPMVNNVYQQPQMAPQKNGSNKKAIAVIAAVVVCALVAGIVTFSLLNKKSNGNNYYDEPTSSTVSTNTSDGVTYKGFTFEKLSEYEYQVTSDALVIGNNNVAFALNVLGADYSQVVASKNEIVQEMQDEGYAISNVQEKTENGRNFITMEGVSNGRTVIIGITKASSGMVFLTAIAVPGYTADYSKLSTLTEILDKASYTGGDDTYASALPTEYEIDDLVESIEFK